MRYGLTLWVVLGCLACDRGSGALRLDAAGPDARAPVDAAQRDARAPDDAAPRDARAPDDAARPELDAGRRDAAHADAGRPEAAHPDAAHPDAEADAQAGRLDAESARPDARLADARLADATLADAHLDGAAPAAPRFLALGDSYTIGTSVAPEQRWPAQLVGLVRAQGGVLGDPRYIAQNGWTTFALDAALNREAPEGPFALVTLLIGVNDQFFHETSLAYGNRFEGLLGRAIGLAGGDPCHVLVLSIPDYSVTPFGMSIDPPRIAREIEEFNRINRAATDARGVRYVDVTPSSQRAAEDPGLIAADGLHPSGRLYAEWAALALPAAQASLACP